MVRLLDAHGAGCDVLIGALLWLAVQLHRWQRWVQRKSLRLRGSLLRLRRRWQQLPRAAAEPQRRWAWNRTPPVVEERLVHLHVDLPHLGAGQLAMLARRVLGLVTTRETVRRILLRRQALVVQLEEAKQRRRRRIHVKRRLALWGADFTLVWVLGFFPVGLLGVIDYQGSRLVAFECVSGPTASELVRVVRSSIAKHGTPSRLLTDNGAAFVSKDFAAFLDRRGVVHSFIRPGHAWTNGRIERVFRTFKETVFGFIWLFSGTAQVERFAADFLQWHNRDRPHSSWGGRTPDEVWLGRKPHQRPRGHERVTYFDGHLHWWRFG